jgi:signal transduction histidine kinase
VLALSRSPKWTRPRYWGIPARSAVVSATVVLVALTLAGAGLALVLYTSLRSGLDDAAAARVRDVIAGLQTDTAQDLDSALLATDKRVVAVQVLNSAGVVARRSDNNPDTPLMPVDRVGSTLRSGIPVTTKSDGDMRVSAQTVDTPTGRYTVLVGANTDSAESTVSTVVVLLAVASPIVVAVSAGATYLLVRRSLRSVDAIRARVSDISASDLTERVPVPQNRDEISSLAATMNEMLARIESGHTAQVRFVGDASHELRSPLATLISALEVGVAHPDLLDEHLVNATLLPEARRMQLLLDDLLLLARADERGLTMRRDDVDLDDLAAGEAARLGHEKAIDVGTNLTPTRVQGDADRLSQVLRNLLDNAARHAKTRVEVTVRHDADRAWLTVSDDGPGIRAADRSRVFDRFVRLDSDRSRSAGGTGLGLAIVSEIVAAHGGSVKVGDRPDGGTLFSVQLPLANAPESSR